MPANGSQGITEGGLLLDVPAVVAYRQFVREKQLGDDGHQAEETAETRRGAFDSPVLPLALGLEAQKGTQFFESDFDIPAPGGPQDDLFGRHLRIRTEESRRWEAFLSTPYQHPAQENRVFSWGMPEGDPGDEFEEMFLAIKHQLEFLPFGFWVFQRSESRVWRFPFLGLGPRLLFGCGFGKANKRASRRRRETRLTRFLSR